MIKKWEPPEIYSLSVKETHGYQWSRTTLTNSPATDTVKELVQEGKTSGSLTVDQYVYNKYGVN